MARLSKVSRFILVVLLLLTITCAWNVAIAYYEDVKLLQLSPSSGVEETIVDVTMNVRAYFEGKGESFPSSYIGLRYILAWDPLGQDNSLSVGALLSPRNLKQIGSATIDSYGVLSGSAQIPWVSSYDYGIHNIFAIYESNNIDYKEWWWATFNYDGDSGYTDSYTLTVYTTGGGYVTKDPDQSYYDYGSSVTLTAHANSGWRFSEWSGDMSGTSESISVYVLKNSQVTATFVESEGGAGPCIIATATYGSSFSPEVSFMRHVRDDLIGSNDVGQALVKSWNTFYYSWSPTIARIIASSNQLRTIASVLLTPLLGTMHVVAFQYALLAPVNPELASTLSFLTAAVLATAIYIVLPVWLTYSLLKQSSWLKQIVKRVLWNGD